MEGVVNNIPKYFFLALLVVFLLPVFCLAGEKSLVINEVYYDTIGIDSKEEFVEIYNQTGEVVDLNNWRLEDNSNSGRYVFEDISIPGEGFLILARDRAGFQELFNFDPDLANLKINLNNSGDYLELYNPDNNLVDKISWELKEDDPSAKTGESIERSPAGSDNITISVQPTPGLGLISPPKIKDIKVSQEVAEIDYYAPNSAEFDRLEVYLDDGSGFKLEKSYLSQPNRIIIDNLELASNYIVKINLVLIYQSKEYGFESQPKQFKTDFDYSDQVVISELYPNPEEGEEEFIELYNSSSRTVSLDGWSLEDNAKSYYLDGHKIAPGEYYLLTKSQTGISLNNSGDKLSLIYPDGSISDQTEYQLIDRGISWSRNAKNSFSKTSKPTPGTENIYSNLEQNEERPILDLTIAQSLKVDDGRLVRIRGKLSVSRNVFGKQYLYLQDNTAGIQLYNYHGRWPKLKLGDKIEVIGELSSVRGERRIKITSIDNISIIGRNNKIRPCRLNWSNPDRQIGKLVRTKAEVSGSAGSTFYLANKNHEIKVYIKGSTGINKPKTYKGSLVEVVGILTKTSVGYKILPRKNMDITLIQSPADQATSDKYSLASYSKNGEAVSLANKASPRVAGSIDMPNPVDYRDKFNNNSQAKQFQFAYLLIAFGLLGLFGLGGYSYLEQYLEI